MAVPKPVCYYPRWTICISVSQVSKRGQDKFKPDFRLRKNWSNLQFLNAILTVTEQKNLLVVQITMAPPTKEVS